MPLFFEPAMRDSTSKPLASLFAERHIFTVSELTDRIGATLASEFVDLEVQGEVSNFKRHQSGHWYFTLKDSRAQIRAVFFRQWNRLLRFEPENGLEVRVRGRVSVYDVQGIYQILVDTLQPVRTGALQLAFEQLRKRLEGAGLFNKEHKLKLPLLPRRIGIVTSPVGSVIRDILHVLGRRHPSIPIMIAPVRVQGSTAAAEIVEAIRLFNVRVKQLAKDVDVIILARGGGSIEDLWAFNEEIVAHAIYASKIPIVSAIGHETDFTIADLVADLRAPTPSAAAELVAPAAHDLRVRVEELSGSLGRLMNHYLLRRRSRLQRVVSSRGFAAAEIQLRSLTTFWRELEERAVRAFQKRFLHARQRARDAHRQLAATDLRVPARFAATRAVTLEQRLVRAIDRQLERRRHELMIRSGHLEMLSPLKVLGRGYALAKDAGGRLVTEAQGLVAGDHLTLRFADGEVGCEVTDAVDSEARLA